MKNTIALISVFVLIMLVAACSSNMENQSPDNSAETVAAIVNATPSSVPTTTPTLALTDTSELTEETPTDPIPTSTSTQTLVPLYWEVTWENLGRSEQEILVNQQTNERITLHGSTFQAPLPSEKNDLVNNVNLYYSNNNMANMGWTFVGGWGGVEGLLTEFYNESGYFLMVKTNRGQSSSITIWISDQTTIVPTIPPTPNQ
jgi:hypothetical protein